MALYKTDSSQEGGLVLSESHVLLKYLALCAESLIALRSIGLCYLQRTAHDALRKTVLLKRLRVKCWMWRSREVTDVLLSTVAKTPKICLHEIKCCEVMPKVVLNE